MAEKRKKVLGSLQPDIEDILDWNKLPEDAFQPASAEEKESFIQDRKSVSYWKDAWRRLRRNKVAMVAMVIVILLGLFAFVGPLIVPYSYDEVIPGANNLHPWHYSLEDQEELAAAQDPEMAIELARAEAEAEGRELSRIEEAQIRAQVKSGGDVDELRAELGIKPKLFGYTNDELQRIADGEFVFPHVFGCDMQGRDIMVRTMIGTRVSMIVGICCALIVLVIGAIYGSISGYCGGKVDAVMQRIVEIIYTIPEVLIILLLGATLKPILENFQNSGDGFLQNMVTILGPNLIAIFIAFGLLYWVTMSRIIRGQILQLKQQEYVTAARALGAKGGRIIKRHLLPNCVGQIVTTTFLQIPSAIFTESFLSFLGMGVSAPMTSLGSMCSDGLSGLQSYPYRLFIPAIILSILILCLNLFGDGLRDALDPRLKK
ncbi:ABC transporter permease [Flavonifractor plautii]|uniref:ABC transporter permease n=1 Tax=Candidatus Flavonifractor intestinigallinarum TaxID=2838586 RepID=A0A9D2MN45_9FIRM|nr:ABC transporter permease [Flavonifractor plautii]MBM6665741.1 ABC transporter permease [Flavonifractor plautii]HJB81480.1 ABC transporter permease [Candidatus Flavonifractor intestinigallinarum]